MYINVSKFKGSFLYKLLVYLIMVQLSKITTLQKAKLIGRASIHAVILSRIPENQLSKQSVKFLKTKTNNPKLSSRLEASKKNPRIKSFKLKRKSML